MLDRVLIIAEAGVNHNGSLEMAKQLIDVAAEAGADHVKFQTFKADKIVSPEARKADYQIQNLNDGEDTQYGMLKKLELSEEAHYELKQYAEAKGIAFLSTGFDEDSIDFLDTLGIPFYKVPSGEITNKPYLQHIASKKKPIILSTGMSNMDDIKTAIEVIEQAGISKSNITVLHCNSEYPTPMKDVNLKAMNFIGEQLGVNIGYSDHTMGIEVPIAAVAMGANVIEKHFTLDRTLPGPDHLASLEPAELKAMVSAIRNIEQAIGGSGTKEPSASEHKNRELGRKSLHYIADLPEGHMLSKDDLISLRPGTGISPMQIDTVIGQRLREGVKKNQMVQAANFS